MEKINAILTGIRKSLPGSTKWEEDNRFNTLLTTASAVDADSLLKKLTPLFENIWNSSTSGKATKPEKKLMKSLSGINNDQMLFTSIEGETVLFAAWWPWGDKSKVSLRIGLFNGEMEINGRDQIRSYLTGTP